MEEIGKVWRTAKDQLRTQQQEMKWVRDALFVFTCIHQSLPIKFLAYVIGIINP